MKIRDLLANQKYQQKKVLEKILCHHTGLTKESLMLNYDTEIDDETIVKINADYEQYTEHDKPLEYIFGYVEFFQRKFKIDGRALIPRPETEYMIEGVNEHIQNVKNNEQRAEGDKVFIDVGTGCGVLGLSILMEHPDYFDISFLTEYYENTLLLAIENFTHYGRGGLNLLGKGAAYMVKANLVDFLAKDLAVREQEPGAITYDIRKAESIVLVANLPYIPDEVFDTQTEDNVRKREPRPAFVGGHDGLDFYREMFAQIFSIEKTLPQTRTMFLEMMTWQVDILRKEFGDKIDFEEIKTFHFNIRIVKGTLK